MSVHYYNVVASDDLWTIREGDQVLESSFASPCEAVDAARRLAIAYWRRNGEPTAVRLFRSGLDQDWVEDVKFGNRGP